MSLELSELINQISTNELVPEMCIKIVNDIKEGNMTIVSLVNGLGALLTDSDKEKRKNGIEILTLILSQLSVNILDATEITYLTEYYCGCLLDHHSMLPFILKGILSLAMMEKFPKNAVQKLFTVFNLHFICQSQERDDRLTFYKILFQLIHVKHEDLLILGPDFVFGVLSAVNGEKDAVNLLYLFKNLPIFFNLFPLGHLTEDAFEVVSCYFPVDYESSATVTREELAENLNKCLVATDEFVEDTINLALDKLSSALKISKMDSLALLKLSFSKFKREKISPFVRNITSALWQELRIGNLDPDIQSEIHSTVVVLINTCIVQEAGQTTFNTVLNDSYKCVHGFLTDLNFASFTPALTFLLTISKTSLFACKFITSKLLASLASIVPITTSDAISLMKAYNRVIKICHLYSVNPSELEGVDTCWNEILQLYISYMETCDVLIITQIIRFFSYVISVLDEHNRREACSLFYRSFPNGNQKFRKKLLRGWKYAAKAFPDEVESFLILQIKNDPGNSTETVEKHLTVLCTLCVAANFIPHLCSYIEVYMVQDNHIYVPCVVQSLKDHIARLKDEKERSNMYVFSDVETHSFLINYLCDAWRNVFLADQRKNHSINRNLSIILLRLISVLETRYQIEILNNQSTRYFNLLKDSVSPIMIVEGIIGGVTSEALEYVDVCLLLQEVIKACIRVTSMSDFHSGGRIVASILNKTRTVAKMQEIQDVVLSMAESKNECIEIRERAVLLLAYAIKGLLLREHECVVDHLNKYLDYNNDENVGKIVSEGFKIMMTRDDWFLTDSCHVEIRQSYKRTLFNMTGLELLNNAKESSDASVKSNCITSLACQLLSIDYTDIRDIVNKALPQFIEMLNTNVPFDNILSVLKTFRELLKNTEKIFQDYISTLIPIFLRLAKDTRCVEVRVCSLECLYYFTKYETYMILPYKSQVIAELATCLNDHKRLVRREAVSTRCIWYTVGI